MYAGQVCVEILNGATDFAKITYDTSKGKACLNEVQAYLGDNIPMTDTGNPAIGTFNAKGVVSGTKCVQSYSVTTPLTPDCKKGSLFTDRIYKLAAHATVKFIGGTEETAWSQGLAIVDGGSWATYSEVKLSCTCGPLTKAPTAKPSKVPTKVCSFVYFCLQVPLKIVYSHSTLSCLLTLYRIRHPNRPRHRRRSQRKLLR